MEKDYKLRRRDFLKLGVMGMGALAMNSVGCDPYDYGKKHVIFRMDDVQAGWLEEEAAKLVKIHIEKNIPITLGVIPELLYKIEGEPNSITENLKKWDKNNKNLVEIAGHSYAHEEDLNYENMDLDEQVEDIEKCKRALNDLGINPITFILPYNCGNEYTPQAIKDGGFKIGISTPKNPYIDIDRIKDPMILEGGIEYKKDFNGFNFSDWDAGDVSNFIDSDDKDYIVVAYHQQNFDPEKTSEKDWQEFENFLEDMKGMEKYSFMTAKQYYNHVLGQ